MSQKTGMGSYYYGYGFGVLDVLPFGCLLCQIVKSLVTLKDTCILFCATVSFNDFPNNEKHCNEAKNHFIEKNLVFLVEKPC